MKRLFTLLTLLALLLVSFNYVYASEAYKANLNDISSTRESMKSTARIKANREREVPSWKGYLISTKKAEEATQRLYHQINDIRYKNQLLEDDLSGRKMESARAAQVHWKDLVNVVRTQLTIDKSNHNKSYTLQGEKDRALQVLNWTTLFQRYANGLSTFTDIYYDEISYHYIDLRNTLRYAKERHDLAYTQYTKAANAVEAFSERKILERMNRDFTKADNFYKSYVQAKADFNEDNAPVKEVLLDDWVTDQPTFNYTLPCSIEKTSVVGIVVHGKDRRDILEKQEDGSLKYPKDVSIAFDKFKASCAAIVVPKSSIGAFVNDEGKVFYFRDWKMGSLDQNITLKEEINTIIDLIYIAKDVVKKPIYLVYGHDEGALSIEVLNELKKRSDIDQTNPDYPIKGYVVVDTTTGVFTVHDLEDTKLRAES